MSLEFVSGNISEIAIVVLRRQVRLPILSDSEGIKPGNLAKACSSNPWEVEAGRSEIQDYPWLYM